MTNSADPKRYSLGWFLRIPLMISRKRQSGSLAPRPGGTFSYAQFGEDIVVASILWYLGVTKPVYLRHRRLCAGRAQ